MGRLRDALLNVLGDVKVFRWPMWVVYDPGSYRVKGRDMRAVIDRVRPGDVLVRGYDAYLDGKLIPGLFSHAGLYLGRTTDADCCAVPLAHRERLALGEQTVIHAIAEGVLTEDVLDFCRCDRLVVLRFPGRLRARPGRRRTIPARSAWTSARSATGSWRVARLRSRRCGRSCGASRSRSSGSRTTSTSTSRTCGDSRAPSSSTGPRARSRRSSGCSRNDTGSWASPGRASCPTRSCGRRSSSSMRAARSTRSSSERCGRARHPSRRRRRSRWRDDERAERRRRRGQFPRAQRASAAALARASDDHARVRNASVESANHARVRFRALVGPLEAGDEALRVRELDPRLLPDLREVRGALGAAVGPDPGGRWRRALFLALARREGDHRSDAPGRLGPLRPRGCGIRHCDRRGRHDGERADVGVLGPRLLHAQITLGELDGVTGRVVPTEHLDAGGPRVDAALREGRLWPGAGGQCGERGGDEECARLHDGGPSATTTFARTRGCARLRVRACGGGGHASWGMRPEPGSSIVRGEAPFARAEDQRGIHQPLMDSTVRA